MDLNEAGLLKELAAADTDDLLDRFTAYRAGMEPVALELIAKELYRRGVSANRIMQLRETYERECIFHPDGVAIMCSYCRKPAIKQGWGWHRLWGRVLILPRWLRYCAEHAK
jgi:hypothetical protein